MIRIRKYGKRKRYPKLTDKERAKAIAIIKEELGLDPDEERFLDFHGPEPEPEPTQEERQLACEREIAEMKLWAKTYGYTGVAYFEEQIRAKWKIPDE
jgi:hypothetical protein